MARQGLTDDRLVRVPLFDGLSRRQLQQISSLMTAVESSAAKVLVERDHGDDGRPTREFDSQSNL
jgi:hypothetical protein